MIKTVEAYLMFAFDPTYKWFHIYQKSFVFVYYTIQYITFLSSVLRHKALKIIWSCSLSSTYLQGLFSF